ncbi:protein anachronism isoform X1 [Zeugodacus cucurbitae]|uniref:protein anachronism isoform X1 n=1 Tax=Zeugodacus cucurbitae TaxID=28588 RepID=UPI0023D93B27|nr:protein anachronism isoform X1 [Zeugodacus cucurbitae]
MALLKYVFFELCTLLVFWSQINAHLLKRGASFMDDDATVRTEIVDRNNRTILARFNLTVAQMNSIMQSQNPNNEDRVGQDATQRFHVIKEFRINDIKNRLQSAFQASNSDENQGHPLHEIAAYPICNSESTESSWMHDNNVTIRFSDSLFEPKRDNLNLDSAILRLYKVNPNNTDDPNASNDDGDKEAKSCGDPLTLTPQIRVTVSIVRQLRRNKRERKKHICNTTMMNISKTGWVEIDIKRAIYIWESVERQQQQQSRQQPIQIGWLMIEVHDEEENPLKPGLFFNPPKCDQAEFAIPWNYYGPHTSMSPFAAHEVPRYPRLDVKLVGYASFAPKNIKKEVHDMLRGNLRRQLFNHSKASEEDLQPDEQHSTSEKTPPVDNLFQLSASMDVEPKHSAKKRQSDQNISVQNFHIAHHDHNHRSHKHNLHVNNEKQDLTTSKQKARPETFQSHNGGPQYKIHNRHNSHRRNHHPHKQHQHLTFPTNSPVH